MACAGAAEPDTATDAHASRTDCSFRQTRAFEATALALVVSVAVSADDLGLRRSLSALFMAPQVPTCNGPDPFPLLAVNYLI